MTKIPKRKFKIVLLCILLFIFIFCIFSYVRKAFNKSRGDEELVVLEQAPSFLLDPNIKNETFYDKGGNKYFVDADGNLHYFKDGKEYVVLPDGSVFVKNADGTLSPVSEEEKASILRALQNENNSTLENYFTDKAGLKDKINLFDANKETLKEIASSLGLDETKLNQMLDKLKGIDKDTLLAMNDEELANLAKELGIPLEVLKAYRDNLKNGKESFTLADLEKALLGEEKAKENLEKTMQDEIRELLKSAGIDDITAEEILAKMKENGVSYKEFLDDVFKDGMAGALENLGFQVKKDKEEDLSSLLTTTEEKIDPLTESLNSLLASSTDSNLDALAQAVSGSGSFVSQNDQKGKQSFIAEARTGSKVLSTKKSDNMLLKGTLIKATLLNNVNSDLPSEVYALVSENVYDSWGFNNILIPKGSRLCGYLNSSVSWGQTSIQIVFTELIRPDGVILKLNGYSSTDTMGETGSGANVNNHIGSIVGAGFLSTLIKYANNKAGEVTDMELLNDALSGTSDSATKIADKFLNKAIDRQPTLTMKAGTKIFAISNDNFTLPIFKRY